MKRFVKVSALLGVLIFVPQLAMAQDTSSGSLTVTATVDSSIKLTFENDGAGVPMTGAGSNAATLAFGTVSAFETISTTGVTRSVNGNTDFTVSSPFGVKVIQANSASADYTLQAALGSTDATNTWKVNSTTLTTTDQTLGSAFSYGSAAAHTVSLTVPQSAAASSISKMVNFTATAN
jgi:hypothetical protein